jgi:lysine biosynthesis protein LysW
MTVGFCPECESSIPLGEDPFVGKQVTCAKCGSFLEIVDLSPVQLDWAYFDDDTDEDDD